MARDAPATQTASDLPATGSNAATYAAFLATAVLAGGNAVAIRIGYAELAPFWGAAVRFLVAGAILFAAVAVLRLALPAGWALVGVLLYGLFNFGTAYMFLYFALTEVTGGTVMIVLALVPLLTLIMAVAIGLERLSARAVVGALAAAIGIGVVFWDSVTTASPAALASALGGAVSIALAPIVVKRFPRVHAVPENAIGMVIGGAWLLGLSLLTAEPKVIPVGLPTQLSLLYLIVLGSIGLFLLFMYVLRRMPASAATYILLLAPLSAVVLEAALLGETVGLPFVAGGLLVLAGVYIGVIRRAAGAPA